MSHYSDVGENSEERDLELGENIYLRENSIYTIVDGPGWTWKEAQSEATSIGGNLVTINDESENQFLVDNFGFQNSIILNDFLVSDPSEGTTTDLKELILDLNSNIAKNWSGNLGLRRNLVNNEDVNTSFGLNFRNECIDINLTLSRRNTTTSLLPKDSRIDLVVNFGNIGSRYYNTKMSKCVIR